MSEKVFVEVGVFNIDPSISDEYNVPIGLAIGHQDCDGGGAKRLTILLARYGHHDELYKAYLASLSENHDPYTIDDYANKVDAIGFFNKTPSPMSTVRKEMVSVTLSESWRLERCIVL